jgi:cytochrome c oxidase assembly protein subunit 15
MNAIHPDLAPLARTAKIFSKVFRTTGKVSEPDLAGALRDAVAKNTGWLRREHRVGDPERYMRHLLYVDPDDDFVITAIIWLPGQQSPVHGHYVWCAYGIVEGELTEEMFRAPGPLLETVRTTVLRAGQVAEIDLGGPMYHRVSNRTQRPRVTLPTIPMSRRRPDHRHQPDLRRRMSGADRRAGKDGGAVAAWLFICAAFTFAIIVVGGITRLTHSGLSIVEWQPLIGAVPPLSQADWETLFAKYRETPQFQQVFPGMDLEGFKSIFWWEYIHRLLGRVTGFVFLLPFVFFYLKKKLSNPMAWKVAGVFVLGGLQGALGWYMVQSGLVDDPRVSHFRLTAHLGLALLIFSAELWLALDLLNHSNSKKRGPLPLVVLGLVFLMALSGGFVAGLRAGHAYNTFPLMNGHLIPPEAFMLEPWWRNFFWNVATVQLVHRTIFWLLLILIPLLWWQARRTQAKIAAHHLLGMFVLQASLGISTLLLAVPIPLAAAHQAGAVLLLACALWTAHKLRSVS